MKKARYTTGLVLLILIASLIQWPMGKAIVPQQQTIGIIDTHDDRFITESGVGIDAWLCHITDPNMDIVSYLVFRGLEINWWEPLTNATLRLRTTVTLDFDADSSVTVYGMKFSDLQDEGWLRPSFVLSVPLTSAHVNVNTSQFYGQQWHEVNVTNIVEELKQSIDWDGHGTGDDTGDDIGFVIFGAEGYDTRWFIDYHYGTPSLASQLVIHWNHEVSPPVGYEEYEFNQTYGNYTIWRLNGTLGYPLEPMEYIFMNHTSVDIYTAYGNTTEINYAVDIDEVSTVVADTQGRKITRLSNGTIYALYRKKLATKEHIYIQKSDDEGKTWNNEVRISNRTDSTTQVQGIPSMAVDAKDTLHIVWNGRTDTYPTLDQIWYAKYNGTLTIPERISTLADMSTRSQEYVSIAVDSNDRLHVVWKGGTATVSSQIFYIKWMDGWGTSYHISGTTGVTYLPDIAVDSNNSLHVVWRGTFTGYPANTQIWYMKYDGSEWLSRVRVSTLAGMEDASQTFPSIAVDSNDNLHAVWSGIVTGFGANQQTWYNENITSWGEPVHLSTYDGMSSYYQSFPDISLDSSDYIHVLWSGKATGVTSYDSIWYSNYTTVWTGPLNLQLQESKAPHIRWSRWPKPSNETFIITDYNGTVIMDNSDPLIFNDTDSVYDWIDTEDPRPTDPDPPGWPETGYFIRFRMRLYFLIIGLGCIFGPILFFAWRRPSGYYILCGAILMLMGIGMLISIGQV